MASRRHSLGLVVEIEADDGGYYSGYNVSLNGIFLGRRPYDGSSHEEVAEEVLEVLAGMLRERLRWENDDDE